MGGDGFLQDMDCRDHRIIEALRSDGCLLLQWERRCISWCSQSCCCKKEQGIAGTVCSLSCRNIIITFIKPISTGMERWD